MNRTLLLFIVDFLFLNLIALTRWERAEPAHPRQPPVNEISANAVTKDQDLVEAMRQSLAEEQLSREALEQKLDSADSTLASREKSLGQLQTDSQKLTAQLVDTQKSQAELNMKYQSETEENAVSRSQLAELQRALEDKKAESERQKAALAALQQQEADARKQIEGLTVAVAVGQHENAQLVAKASDLEGQVQSERTERVKVEAATNQLAEGVGQLAENSGELTKEIRDNRPISANVLFNDFLANRVQADFTATRKGLFGPTTKDREAKTVFTTDGKQVYALLEVDDTPFSFGDVGADWQKIAVHFERPPDYGSSGTKIEFLEIDPRVVVVPVDASQVAALGAKVYPLAADPFKFPEAVLISGGGQGYGELGFKVDAEHRGYVKLDNRLFKRLFGDFAPSRGDLVFSKTGELLGIMVNNDYCVLLGDFTPEATIEAGEDQASEKTGAVIDSLSAHVRQMPIELQ
jgi:X-X-X-Leu-X-X-Gly heptad repeat protein